MVLDAQLHLLIINNVHVPIDIGLTGQSSFFLFREAALLEIFSHRPDDSFISGYLFLSDITRIIFSSSLNNKKHGTV